MIDTSVPFSPDWTLARLAGKLAAKKDGFDKLERYLRGNPPVTMTSKTSSAFQDFLRRCRLNFAELVTQAITDRLEPVAFRMGADGGAQADSDAWRHWQANRMDGAVKPFHETVVALGEAYSMVHGVDPLTGSPGITLEDPRNVITEADPARPWRVDRALKLYSTDTEDVALVFPRPGEVYYYHRPHRNGAMMDARVSDFQLYDARYVPLSRIPVVKYVNKRDLQGQTFGEFEGVLDHLDRINDMILQRMVIATYQAFKQRAVMGLPVKGPDGSPIDYRGVFESGPDALWQLPATAQMWESGQVDMTGILMAADADVKTLSAVTRTPLYMLSADAASGSAEGASLQREGLTFNVKDHHTLLGESHEQTMSLVFEVAGDIARAAAPDMELVWAPVSSLSLSEKYDAGSKASAAGVPWEYVMSDVLQFTPQQIEHMRPMHEAEVAREQQALVPQRSQPAAP